MSPITLGKTPSPPSSWCEEVRKRFSPVKPLGTGGFGSVWLANKKESVDDEEAEDNVAIKVVGHPHNQKISSFEKMSEAGYFQREVSILQEISHRRIVRCFQVIEDSTPNSSYAPYCMVLEYCRGPTLEKMINYGGCLGIYMAQEVSSQLVDVVSYLHSRAVIHRDIKPDNIIVRGATYCDEACWSDDIEGSDGAKSMKWSIKLIDFGFARPLRPEDVSDENKTITLKKNEPNDAFFGRSTVDNKLDDKSLHRAILNLSMSGGKYDDLSNSISRRTFLDLSAVGNRHFAAPEITKGVRIFKKRNKSKKTKEDQQPLSECVSDYGMIVDAFSTGATIRYMCTGVPPQESIEDFLRQKNSVFRSFGKKLKKAGKKMDDSNKRKKRYQSNNDLPPEAVRVILGLTHWDSKKRTTIRSARDYEWISCSYSMKSTEHTESECHGGKLDFLKCAMKHT